MQLNKPGLYTGIAPADYFADPAPQPSLTQSLAKIILDRSPLHAWYAHPRLNPDFVDDDATKYDVGNIAHTLLIGRGKTIEVLEDFDDWRTKAAKEQREAAAAAGRLAVLPKHFAKADRMVSSARTQLAQRGLEDLFTEGHGEVVLLWQEDHIWLRQMIDWLTPDRMTFCDFKTTEQSASPVKLDAKMWNDGWHIQAAMAERGLDAMDPTSHGRRDYLFVVQEAAPPYLLTVARICEAPLTIARKQLQWAVDRWTECQANNVYPGYPLETVEPAMPGWAEQQWLSREIDEEDARRRGTPSDILMGG